MRLNHRGQTLILFVLLLPVLLLVLGLLIQLGNLQIQKQKIDQTITNALIYGMEHIDDSSLEVDIQKILLLNLKKIQHKMIEINDNKITIAITQSSNFLFPNLFKNLENSITIQKSIYFKDGTYKIIKE